MKAVDHFAGGPGAEKAGAIAGKDESVKGFVHFRAGGDFGGREVEDEDFVGAIAAMEDGGVFAAGMKGEVDGEIVEGDLGADGAEGPLVGEKDGAVGTLAGKIGGVERGEREEENGGELEGAHKIRLSGDKLS
jgi:hypothetical protein